MCAPLGRLSPCVALTDERLVRMSPPLQGPPPNPKSLSQRTEGPQPFHRQAAHLRWHLSGSWSLQSRAGCGRRQVAGDDWSSIASCAVGLTGTSGALLGCEKQLSSWVAMSLWGHGAGTVQANGGYMATNSRRGVQGCIGGATMIFKKLTAP
jgi:hypothetical protein